MSLEHHPLWRRPQHHMDAQQSNDHVHWLELFYDLAHVVAIFILGNYLSHHLNIQGFLAFTALFCIIWFAWFDLSLFNSLYVSTDIQHRNIMAAQIVTVMLMSAAISTIASGGWTYFAMAYAINRLILALLFWRARFVGDTHSRLPSEISRNFLLSSIVFASSALLSPIDSYVMFALGMIFLMSSYALPTIGVLRHERFRPRFGHMAERFSLLLLIAAGEGFFKLVITLADKGISNVSTDVFFNYIFGGFSIFVLCWIYFDFAGNGKPKDNKKSTLIQWVLAHLGLMVAVVCIGVALSAEVKIEFTEVYPLKYAVLGCASLAAYLYFLLLIQNVIEHRAAHRFATPQVRWVGITLALLTLAVVAFVPSWVANLLWGSALISQIVIPVSRAYFTFIRDDASTRDDEASAG